MPPSRLLALLLCLFASPAFAQSPPTPAEVARYTGLHAAAQAGDVAAIERLAGQGADLEARDPAGRTPLHVAAFASQEGAARALVAAGADPDAQEGRRYDIVTIAAVADDLPMLRTALELGASPRAITSPYDGTALIAAAHLGHVAVVETLITAGAPLDHVNNLGWTALIEAVVLGDGGARHTAVVRALVAAGASTTIGDRQGRTPLQLAKDRGFDELVTILSARKP